MWQHVTRQYVQRQYIQGQNAQQKYKMFDVRSMKNTHSNERYDNNHSNEIVKEKMKSQSRLMDMKMPKMCFTLAKTLMSSMWYGGTA